MKTRLWTYLLIGMLFLSFIGLWSFKNYNFNTDFTVGQRVDSLNGVYVYYNGRVDNVIGRNTTSDGYNLGLKYQCVEFVKRYYYECLKHEMPDSYGHAKDFFDNNLKDGQINHKRALTQYTNSSKTKPIIGDIIPKCPLEIYYEKITPHICFSTQFYVLDIAKAISVGQNFRALQLFCVIFSHYNI